MTATPTQRQAMDRLLAEFRSELHTSFPAKVLAYNAADQTVDVRPALLREVPSDDPVVPWGYEQIPDLYNVPIMWPRAGGFIITFPINAGDWVRVTCAEQSTLNWRNNGAAPAHPGVSDPLGLNGLVADVGWTPDTEKAANVSTTKLVIGKPDGTAILTVDASGNVVIGQGAPGAEKLITNATPLAVILNALQSAINGLAPGTFPDPVLPADIALGKAKGF